MEAKKNDIVLISKEYPNGSKTRIIGVITSMEEREDEKGIYITLAPLPESMKEGFREKYCTPEYNHQGIKNCYSDTYGFAANHLIPGEFEILGQHSFPPAPALHSPRPGNTSYDLMC